VNAVSSAITVDRSARRPWCARPRRPSGSPLDAGGTGLPTRAPPAAAVPDGASPTAAGDPADGIT
jgi:hypothetical protein